MDLTKIEKPFGLLDDATKAALKAHGGPYEVFQSNGEWGVCLSPNWGKTSTYRVKPQQKVRIAPLQVYMGGGQWLHIGSIKIVEGEPYLSSIKLVERPA